MSTPKYQRIAMSALTLSLSVVTACSQTRELHEMHDATADMRDQTHELNDETKQMGVQTKELSAQTKQMGVMTAEMNTQMKGMAADTHDMKGKTTELNDKTTELDKKTGELNVKTGELNEQTKVMGAHIDNMDKQTTQLNAQTKEMGQHIQQMDEKTKQLSETSDQLNAKTGEMYDQLKQGDSLTLRERNLENLASAEDTTRKISIAAKYFMSFEYQIWSGIGQDTKEKRLELAASAAREFMRDVQEFVRPGATEIDPFVDAHPTLLARAFKRVQSLFKGKPEQALTEDVKDSNNRERSLSALAVALHIANPKQEHWIGVYKDIETITMYSMLQNSLKAEVEIEAGRKVVEDYPLYVREILTYHDVAQLLMQTRYNFLGTMAVARLSHIREGETEYVKMLAKSWSADLSSLNTVELKETSRYIAAGMRTRDFLRSVGVEPKLGANLERVMKNANFDSSTAPLSATPAPLPSPPPPSATAPGSRTAAQDELISLFEKFRSQTGEAPAI